MLHCKGDSLPEHERMIVKHENVRPINFDCGKSIRIVMSEKPATFCAWSKAKTIRMVCFTKYFLGRYL
jgi:hypothetical protein